MIHGLINIKEPQKPDDYTQSGDVHCKMFAAVLRNNLKVSNKGRGDRWLMTKVSMESVPKK